VFDAFMTMACGPDYLAVLTGALGSTGVDRARLESSYFFSDEGPAVMSRKFDSATAARVTADVTLAAGEASSPAYREVCRQLSDLLPRAHVAIINEAHHVYPLSDPSGFATFVTTLRARTGQAES
jgi:pimeloyl-ACP methyl ester carboxylesterase